MGKKASCSPESCSASSSYRPVVHWQVEIRNCFGQHHIYPTTTATMPTNLNSPLPERRFQTRAVKFLSMTQNNLNFQVTWILLFDLKNQYQFPPTNGPPPEGSGSEVDVDQSTELAFSRSPTQISQKGSLGSDDVHSSLWSGGHLGGTEMAIG
jgi:hypothetical protein